MKVTLISYTAEAAELLIFTKSTRLNMSPGLLDEIRTWPPEKKAAELAYMVTSIASSWEMVDYVFLVEGVSRAYTHQAVRTRHGSYAQQSLRVVDMSEFNFVMPKRLTNPADIISVEDTLEAIKAGYRDLIEAGAATEDARSILPTNISTNIVCKYNLRTMSELAKSRTGGRTQGEYIDVMDAMCDAVIAVHPWAEQFLFPAGRDHFAEIEAFAEEEFGGDLARKGRLLKIVDVLRKGAGQ